MATVSGVFVWSLPQVDGTTIVRESFSDDQGNDYGTIDYEAPVGYDIAGRLVADIAALQAQVDGD